MIRYKNLIDTLKRPVRMYLGSQTWSQQDAKPLQDLYSSYSKGSYYGICKRQVCIKVLQVFCVESRKPCETTPLFLDEFQPRSARQSPDIPPYVEPAFSY